MAKSNPSRSERTAALIKEQQAKEKRRNLITIAAIVGVLAVIAGLTFFAIARSDRTGDEAAAPRNVSAQDQYVILWGDEDAPKTIDVWEDFQCPACQFYTTEVGEELQKAVDAGKVNVAYHMLAFLNDYSVRALNASAAVLDTAGVEVWKEYYDLLYVNQPTEGGGEGMSDEQLIELAVQAGAEESEIEGPIRDMKFEGWVINATDTMRDNDISGTPSVYVDGEYGGQTPAESVEFTLKHLE